MEKHRILFTSIVTVFLWQAGSAQTSLWDRLEYFKGDWKGHETGRSGIGVGTRTYSYILGNKYMLSKNQSKFEPQEKNPKGEVHQDWTIFSYDNGRKTVAMRQFNSEGFINTFTLDTLTSTSETMIFVSESSENAPPGLRARLTFLLKNGDEFVETFELAFPGKDYSQWLRNEWTRKQ